MRSALRALHAVFCVHTCACMCHSVCEGEKVTRRVCVCVCVRGCERARTLARESICMCMCMSASLRVCVCAVCVCFLGSCLFFGCVCAWHISFNVCVFYNAFFIFSNTTHSPTTADDNAEVHVDEIFDNCRCIARVSETMRAQQCESIFVGPSPPHNVRPTIITSRVVYSHRGEHILMCRQYIRLK